MEGTMISWLETLWRQLSSGYSLILRNDYLRRIRHRGRDIIYDTMKACITATEWYIFLAVAIFPSCTWRPAESTGESEIDITGPHVSPVLDRDWHHSYQTSDSILGREWGFLACASVAKCWLQNGSFFSGWHIADSIQFPRLDCPDGSSYRCTMCACYV